MNAGVVRAALRADGILEVVLSTPGRHNAMSLAMWAGLADAVRRAAAEAQSLLLRGHGASFCSGGDMREYALVGGDGAFGAAYVETFTQAITALRTAAVPTLALLDGPVVGAGAALAAACDFRIATPAARLSITAVKLGLVFPHAELVRLAALLGAGTLRRVMFLGHELDSDALLACGFVEEVVVRDLAEQRAIELLHRLMSYAPDSYRETKQRFALMEAYTVLEGQADNTASLAGFRGAFGSR